MYGEFRASPLGEDEGITIFSLKGHFGGSALGLLLLGKSYQEVTCKDETYTERRSASISFSVILCQGVTKFLVHLHSVLKLAKKSHPFFCEVTIFAPKQYKLTQLALVEIREFFVPFSNTVKNMNILLENEGKGKKVSRLIM